jgi:hypothetical protein
MRCLALFIYITWLSLITHPVDFIYYLLRFKIAVCSGNLNSLQVTVGGVQNLMLFTHFVPFCFPVIEHDSLVISTRPVHILSLHPSFPSLPSWRSSRTLEKWMEGDVWKAELSRNSFGLMKQNRRSTWPYVDIGQTPNTLFVFNKGNINKRNLKNFVRFFLSDLVTLPVTFPTAVATECRAVVAIYIFLTLSFTDCASYPHSVVVSNDCPNKHNVVLVIVSKNMYVLSGRILCDGLITRPEESYRLWSVVCDLKTSWIRRPWPTGGGGFCARNKRTIIKNINCSLWLS